MSRRRASPERTIQRAIVQHLRARGVPGLVFTHCPNGGFRRPVEGAIFKGLGVRAGVSDLLLWHGGKSFALELKGAGGRLSESQQQFIDDFSAAGGLACVATGVDEALYVLERWNLLRGTVQR